jgi:acetyl esterase/lipase
VFIHGGCWRSEYSVSHSRALASRLADTGSAVWSLEYRRLGDPGGGFPGTFEDIELAATSLPLLHSHNIDTEKVLVAGHSAGGQLALWIAARFPEQFTGVIGLAAVTDLARYAEGENPCQRSARELMGGMPDVLPQRYQQYSPSGMQRHPNTHLIHGNNDRIVLPEQQTAMGLPDERLHRTPGAHFDLIHPATRDFKIVEKVMAGMLQ